MKTTPSQVLTQFAACPEAIKYSQTANDPNTLWKNCTNASWLAWWLGRTAGKPGSSARRKLAACMYQIAMKFLERWEKENPENESYRESLGVLKDWAYAQRQVTREDIVSRIKYAYICNIPFSNDLQTMTPLMVMNNPQDAVDIIKSMYPEPPGIRKEEV